MSHRTARLLAAAAWLALSPIGLLAQGSLTPPGPPAASMKTLTEIEPRIALGPLVGNASHVLSNGSYYLTGDLVVAGDVGIYINSNVTLDLNGFTIRRAGGLAAEGSGIRIDGESQQVVVKNGSITRFAHGIRMDASAGNRAASFLQLKIGHCSVAGMETQAGSRIIGCNVSDNPGNGIVAGSGSMITDCIVERNAGRYAIYAGSRSVVDNCIVRLNVTTGPVNGAGIWALEECAIRGCQVSANGHDGIVASSGRSLITGNNVASNGRSGISISVGHSLVSGNTVGSNGTVGINVGGSGNRIEENNAFMNNSGIMVTGPGNFIANNTAFMNQNGIVTTGSGSGNFIVKNTVHGSTSSNFSIQGTQTIGPIITASGTISTTSPWANFSF
jgi:parallel beta-helix repeat protein